MKPSINQSAAPSLDGSLVRRLLGLPAGCDDETVNRTVAQLAKERGGIETQRPVSKTLDEGLFRTLLRISPSTSTEQLNGDLFKFMVNDAANDREASPTDTDEDIRKRMGIDRVTWDRHAGK